MFFQNGRYKRGRAGQRGKRRGAAENWDYHWERVGGDEASVPVVDGGARQHHGVVVGPLGCVAPALLVAVPEVASRRVTYDPLWKTLPDGEGEIHLTRKDTQSHTRADRLRKRKEDSSTLAGIYSAEVTDQQEIPSFSACWLMFCFELRATFFSDLFVFPLPLC